MKNPYEQICLALDVSNETEAVQLVEACQDHPIWFKVGITLWNSKEGGHQLLEKLNRIKPGIKIFLDLKLHDIPFQMQGALLSVRDCGVKLVSIHSGSGPEHISQCVSVANTLGIGLVAITVLTSVKEQEHLTAGHMFNITETVKRRAKYSMRAGASGVVCSAAEVGEIVHLKEGADIKLITPGVEPWPREDDQVRKANPTQAIKSGSDLLVIGRPIRTPPEHIGSTGNALEAIASMIKKAYV